MVTYLPMGTSVHPDHDQLVIIGIILNPIIPYHRHRMLGHVYHTTALHHSHPSNLWWQPYGSHGTLHAPHQQSTVVGSSRHQRPLVGM